MVSGLLLAPVTGSYYDFQQLDEAGFLDEFTVVMDQWSLDADGLSPAGESDPDNPSPINEGRVFVGNSRTEYDVALTAELGPGRPSSPRGGYGIMFETVLDTHDPPRDTGLILQFDRGWEGGALILRRRVSGGERTPDVVLVDRALVPAAADDPGWWSGERQLRLEVRQDPVGGALDRIVRVYVDDALMLTHQFETGVIDPAHNHVGLRTWHESSQTYFRNLHLDDPDD